MRVCTYVCMYVCVLHRSLQASSAALEATYTESRRAIDADNNRLREEWASLKSQLEEERKLVRDGSKITVRFLNFAPGPSCTAPDIYARACVSAVQIAHRTIFEVDWSDQNVNTTRPKNSWLRRGYVFRPCVCMCMCMCVCVCVCVYLHMCTHALVLPISS